MDVWLAVRQNGRILPIETRYEDTVTNLGSEGRRVTEFLGLSWHEDQSKFYQRRMIKSAFFSPTYHDASQPVYKRSVARWTAYEKYLAPHQIRRDTVKRSGYET